MPEQLSTVLRAQRGNAGAIQVVSLLGSMASLAAGNVKDPKVQLGVTLAAGALKIAADAMSGRLDPDQIDLDRLFVKSPTQLLEEAGITGDEIEQIIAGTAPRPRGQRTTRAGAPAGARTPRRR